MKGFIKVTQTNNQWTFINVSNILFFYRSLNGITIVMKGQVDIECKQTLEELEKLINNASTF